MKPYLQSNDKDVPMAIPGFLCPYFFWWKRYLMVPPYWAGWFISSENQMETSNWVQSPKKSQNLRNLRSFGCYFRTDASPQGFHVAPWCWYIYLQNWVSFWANVDKYSIHGASGFVEQEWHTQASASSLAQKTSTSILRNWKQHRMVAKSWTSW